MTLACRTLFVTIVVRIEQNKSNTTRVRAWNLIGHSEPPTAHVTTPAAPSLWTKPWRVISPWLRTGNSSAASSAAAPQGSAGETASSISLSPTGGAVGVGSDGGGAAGFVDRGLGVEMEGQGGWGWREVFGAAWSVLSWAGWAVVGLVKMLHAVVVLATLQTNLTVRVRICSAYG